MKSTKQGAVASAGESSVRPGGFRRLLGAVKGKLHSRRSPRRDPVVSQDAVHESVSSAPNIEVQVAPSGVDQGVGVESTLPLVRKAAERANILGVSPARSGAATANEAQAGLDLQPLKIIDAVIEKMINVHPLAKLELSVLSSVAKMILEANYEPEVQPLLVKLVEVYGFMSQKERLDRIPSMLHQITQQTLECARFMRDYSETKMFWTRVGKNVAAETEHVIQQYIAVLDKLMQPQVAHGATIFVQRTGETPDLSGMTYAAGAGLDTTKQCLPGTRIEILSMITEWINSSGDEVPRVLWLSGPAGTGKSVIANTIANWCNDVGVPVSCFCFDRQREADRLHEKIFSTIARDLADCDPKMRGALANAVEMDSAIKNTRDIVQQWKRFIMEPLINHSVSNAIPVVIVIDALDESGGVDTRRVLLRILAGKLQPQITELPNNVRFIVTSRPLRDIDYEFCGVHHIRRISMDDIPTASTKRDIHLYLSQELEGLSFQHRHLAVLAEKADGLFEWARLACSYIKGSHVGLSPMDSFEAVVSSDPWMRRDLLSDLYSFILSEIMPKNLYMHRAYQTMLDRFRSVMGQILGTVEPLPLHSLNAMRCHFPDSDDHYDVEVVVSSMGSLLSGTTNPHAPIRFLHASFRDFLTDETRSRDFFVDVAKARYNLAFASLRVMKKNLRFNICDLESSYIPNCEDLGLQQRVEICISPHLSYSCRHWIAHIRAMDFDTEIAKNIKSFFESERLLFWLEALGLLKAVSGAAVALPLITQWLKTHPEYRDVSSAATDVQRFIQTFGGIILHSTPHLYISALPFSPVNSVMSKFSARFPNTLRLTSGRDMNWPAVQSLLRGHLAGVLAVSLSPDGTRIATGSYDGTVRLWDAATGQPVGEPLQGHTSSVNSVSFSPDGTRIVSGSYDRTVRLWDAGIGQLVCKPLYGHTDSVNSVSFSPDGTRIVSGSNDRTVRLWDAGTGQPVSESLCGHTDSVNSVSFSPDGTRIVSGSDDRTVRLWDAGTGQPVSEPLCGHTDSVNSVSFSPDGTRIVSGSDDMTVRLWDAGTGQPVSKPLCGHTGSVNSVSFSPDGIRIVSGSRDATVRLWDAATGLPLSAQLWGHTSSVNSVSFSPDGTCIVSGSDDKTVRLWDALARQPSQQCAVSEHLAFSDEHCIVHPIESTATMTLNTRNNHLIRFSSNSSDALHNTSELTEGTSHDDRSITPFFLNDGGDWVVGPNDRLLFWVPPTSRHSFYSPGTALVIPRGGPELDLSRMAHGTRWVHCYEDS